MSPRDLAGAAEVFLGPFADLVAERLATRLQNAPLAPSAPTLLEERRCAEHFGCEVRALVGARRARELAGFKVGRRVLLDVAEVERWIRAHRVERVEDADDDDGVKPRGRLRVVAGSRGAR